MDKSELEVGKSYVVRGGRTVKLLGLLDVSHEDGDAFVERYSGAQMHISSTIIEHEA